MVKSTKNQRLLQKVSADNKHSRQTTLDSLPQPLKEKPSEATLHKPKKVIDILDVATCAREDELEVKVTFKLLPSRTSFSRVSADLFFDGERIDALRFRVLQGPLATDCSEFSSKLDMTGVLAGPHVVKVEMYELWGEEEKLVSAAREVIFDYVPVNRTDRLVRVPIVKSVAGDDLSVVTDSERRIYRELEDGMKRVVDTGKDPW